MSVTEFEDYLINKDELIGQGQYGKVYTCKSKTPQQSDMKLCIKVTLALKQIITVTDEKSAKREAEILQTLAEKAQGNENVVEVKKVVHDLQQRRMMVVMERCPGNLKDEMKNKAKYTSAETIDFLKQFLKGYKPLYENNIIHRDIKPENILTSKNSSNKVIYKLADFGVGKIYKKNDFTVTQTGTPVYAPPEINSLVCESEVRQDYLALEKKNAVDVYSIGIILHELLFTKLPFEATPMGIDNFISQLQKKKWKIDYSKDYDSKLLEHIERMIVYMPSERVKFDELYTYYIGEKPTVNIIPKKQFSTIAKNNLQGQNPPQSFQERTLKTNVQPPTGPTIQPQLPAFTQQSQFSQQKQPVGQQQFNPPNKQFPQPQQATPFQQFPQPQQFQPVPQQNIPKQFQTLQSIQNNAQNTQSAIHNQQFQQKQFNQPQFKQPSGNPQQPNQFIQQQNFQQFLPPQDLILLNEFKETIQFLINFSETLNAEVLKNLQSFLDAANKQNKQMLKQSLLNLKGYYSYQQKKNDYKELNIRFLFAFFYFADEKKVQQQDLQKLTIQERRQYLEEWCAK